MTSIPAKLQTELLNYLSTVLAIPIVTIRTIRTVLLSNYLVMYHGKTTWINSD